MPTVPRVGLPTVAELVCESSCGTDVTAEDICEDVIDSKTPGAPAIDVGSFVPADSVTTGWAARGTVADVED